MLAALWLRALARFQEGFLAAAGAHEDALEAAVAGAVSAVAFARAHPEDARVLIEVRLADLLDEGVTEELQAQIDRGNARLVEEIRRLARGTLGRAGAREIDAVVRAVADLPSAVVRRHTRAGMVPPRWLEDAVGRDVRALLGAQRTTR